MKQNSSAWLRRAGMALLVLVLLLPLSHGARAEDLAAWSAKSNGCPYYIMVNRGANTVTVFRQDGEGYYTVPARAMVCSVGKAGSETPLGTFAITGVKMDWCYMLDGSYGQYASQFSGHFLFHSVCYVQADPATLMTGEYNMLGEAASLGCVRLQVADAKWIYDNCGQGTLVTVYDDSENPGPLGKPAPAVAEISAAQDNGWEPTDPREENPWRSLALTDFSLAETALFLEAGQDRSLTLCHSPEDISLPGLSWASSNPAVAAVDAAGRVVALSAGTAEVTASWGTWCASCAVSVTGTLLPFSDLVPGAWYYGDVRRAVSLGRLNGCGDGTFAPERAVTWAEALQALYNLAGRPGTSSAGTVVAWYAAALDWARTAGVLGTEVGASDFALAEQPIARWELALLLWRFAGAHAAPADAAALAVFGDVEPLDTDGRDALGWMVRQGLLLGDGDGLLRPFDSLTRAQLSAILNRL